MRGTLLTWVLGFLLTGLAWGAPRSGDWRPPAPSGFAYTGTVRGPGQDRVVVFNSSKSGRVAIVAPGVRVPVWLSPKKGCHDFPAPIQGACKTTLAQLVYTVTVGGHQLLYVTGCLSGVYSLDVFERVDSVYSRVFETVSLEMPRTDRRDGELRVVAYRAADSSRSRRFTWGNGRYVEQKRPFSWNGSYHYLEHAPPDETWVYRLHIQGTGAFLRIEGFQTDVRYVCRVVTTNGDARIVLVRAAAESTSGQLKPGTLLFTLHRDGAGATETRWAGLRPQLPANEHEKVTFTRD